MCNIHFPLSRVNRQIVKSALFPLEDSVKTINPNERLELFYSFEAIPANNVTRARLFLSTYFRDRKTGKLVSKRYKNDLPIKQIK